MSYTLKLTNGKILLTLPDQQSDRVSTSLTLIGKNVNAYGTDINQNYIHILENFSNNVAPTAPLVGQLWFDSNSQQIKVFTKNNEFKPVGAPIIAAEKPITLNTGDLWYDTTSQQMKFQKDSSTLVVIGPQTDASVGRSGWVNEVLPDAFGNTVTVVSLYSNDVLMGILTNERVTVNPATTTTSGLFNLGEGFNAVSTTTIDVKWWGTAYKADYLIDSLTGDLVSTENILTDNGPVIINNDLTVYSDVSFGSDLDFQFTSTVNISGLHTDATMRIGGYNQNFNFYVNSGYIKDPAIHVNGTSNRVGIYNQNPQYDLDITGDTRITGNLRVEGEATYITSQDLKVLDRNIFLGDVENPTDITANGGGIVLRSGVNNDKEIIWYNSVLDNVYTGVPQTWSVTDNLELRDIDASLYIYGGKVLSRDTLHENIKYAPGLSEIGALTSATIGTLKIEKTGEYETTIGSAVSSSTIILGDIFTTAIDMGGRKVINAATPSAVDTSTYKQSLTTVQWVEDYITIQRNPVMSTTIDVSGIGELSTDKAVDDFVVEMLARLWDPEDPLTVFRAPSNARARVLITRYTVPAMNNVPSEYLDPGVPLYVDKGGVWNSAQVVEWADSYRVTTNIPANTLNIYRAVKEYIVSGNMWVAPNGGQTANLIWTDGNW